MGLTALVQNICVQAVEYNRQLGIQGEIFFFYEGLRENNNTLAKVLRNGPYAKSASFPNLSDLGVGGVSNRKAASIWQGVERLFRNLF